jgi:hypothetical protein
MRFRITSDKGYIILGKLRIVWANALNIGCELPGFLSIEVGSYALEFGDIDQGKPGIYLTSAGYGEVERIKTLWQAK